MILRVDLSATLSPRDVYARLDLPACLDVTLGHHAFASLPFVPVAQDSDPAATPIILIPGEDPLTPASLFALSCATPDAVIYYTTDGSEPTEASALYTTPFTLPAGTYTIKARAYAPGFLPSALASSAEFTVQQILPTEGGILISGYYYHIFEADGELAVLADVDVDYLVLGGGAGGARSSYAVYCGGGGGAGECASGSVSLEAGNTYLISIGAGGAGRVGSGGDGNNGQPSILEEDGGAELVNAIGGGYGSYHGPGGAGASGGGGGGVGNNQAGGTSIAGQGAGGAGFSYIAGTQNAGAGGGGGVTTAGGNGGNGLGGNGGAPVYLGDIWNDLSASDIAALDIGYAFSSYTKGCFGGGGGGGASGAGKTPGASGGAGATAGNSGAHASPNSGSGGGGHINVNASNGGSGIVIVRYAA